MGCALSVSATIIVLHTHSIHCSNIDNYLLEENHFTMVEDMGLKINISKSPSMALPPYQMS
jgi:hypothetical protein